jgi:hypothetical protein
MKLRLQVALLAGAFLALPFFGVGTPVWAQTDVVDDLFIYLSFDSYSATNDLMGNYNGTFGGNGAITNTVGQFQLGDGGATFDGDNDYLTFGDVAEMDEAGAFSVAMWFYRDADGASATNHNVNNVLIGQSSAVDNDNFEFGTAGYTGDGANDGQFEVYLDTAGNDSLQTNTTASIGLGTWHHVVLTYDQNATDELTVYLDGSQAFTLNNYGGDLDTSVTSPLTLGIARPGDDPDGDWGDLDGQIDEFGLWTRALTSTQVADLYASGSGLDFRIGQLTSSTGGDWDTASNWTNGGGTATTPGAGTDVVIDGEAMTVNGTGSRGGHVDISAGSLTVNSGAELKVTGDVSLTGAGSITINNGTPGTLSARSLTSAVGTTVNAIGNLDAVTMSFSGNTNISGAVTADEITFGGANSVTGGSITATTKMTVDSTLDTSAATLDVTGAELDLKSGSLTHGAAVTADTVTANGATINLGDATLTATTQLDVNASTDFSNTTLDLDDVSDTVVLNLNNTAAMTYDTDLTVDNLTPSGGTLNIGGNTLTVENALNVNQNVDIGATVAGLLDLSSATVNLNATLSNGVGLSVDTVLYGASSGLDLGTNAVTIGTLWDHQGGSKTIGGGATDGISGAGDVAVSGGDLTFAAGGAFNYSGATTVSGGTLNIAGTASNTSQLTVSSGTANVSGAVNSAAPVNVTGSGLLKGTGAVGALTVSGGGTVAPGGSIGTMTVSSYTMGAGGNEEVEIKLATGPVAGTDNDLVDSTGSPGTITVSATPVSGNHFTVKPISVTDTAGTTGAIPDFVATNAYSWTIARGANGVSGFDAAAFDVDYRGVQNSLKDALDLSKTPGNFSVSKSGNNINLEYTPPTTSVYAQAVMVDTPIGYWRLNEHNSNDELNVGSATVEVSGADLIGTYAGIASTDRVVGGLVGADEDTALNLDGNDDRITFADHSLINHFSGGNTTSHTIEAWIQADAFTNTGGTDPKNERHVVYSQGGGTRGFAVYVENGQIYYTAWDNGASDHTGDAAWGAGGSSGTPVYVASDASAIDVGKTYHVALVFDAPLLIGDDTNNDNTIRGFINGQEVGVDVGGDRTTVDANSIGWMTNHNHPRIGEANGSLFHDNTGNYAQNFNGTIDEVAVYSQVLTKAQLQKHYATGVFGDFDTGNEYADEVVTGIELNYDARLDSNGSGYWEDATRHNGLEWVLNGAGAGVTPSDVSDPDLALISKAYTNPRGTFNEPGDSFDEIFLENPTKENATFELVFRAPDLDDNHILFETGGSGNGTALKLRGTSLIARAQNGGGGSQGAEVVLNLETAYTDDWEGEFIHAIYSVDVDNDTVSLFVDGELVGSATTSAAQTNFDWAGTDGSGLGRLTGSVAGGDGGYSNFDGEIALFRFYRGVVFDQTMAEQNYQALGVVPEPSSLLLICLGMIGLLARRRRQR